jgi:general secretion pathway protein E
MDHDGVFRGHEHSPLERTADVGQTPSQPSSTEPGTPLISASELPPAAAVTSAVVRLRIARAWLNRTQTIAWFRATPDGERLCVASANIDDASVREAAEQFHHAAPICFRAEPNVLRPYFAELAAEMEADLAVARADPARLRELAEEAPVIDFVNTMLTEAVAKRASDVHIEPFEDRLTVRFRVDGALMLWRTAPRALFDAISSRIKILSGMDIAERRLPQDGRQTLRIGGGELDARVSSLPTTWGESVVIRFLGKHSGLPDLDELGFAGDQRTLVRELVGASSGMVLVTGPTGSGKTTTVYRLITDLNHGLSKIVSVEDPVEMDLPGVLQTQVRSEIGLGFATGLRSILRQDPDVILVGEIRDSDTASIAVQAALTGHLVISTIHTTTALAALTRLLDLGVEGFFVADVLRGLIGQRLVRRLCPHCSTPLITPGEGASEEAFAHMHLSASAMSEPPAWRKANGCDHCANTGYLGRLGVFETIATTPALRAAIRERADEGTLESIARSAGFRSAFEDGVAKARAGMTTLQEVQRAIGGSRV